MTAHFRRRLRLTFFFGEESHFVQNHLKSKNQKVSVRILVFAGINTRIFFLTIWQLFDFKSRFFGEKIRHFVAAKSSKIKILKNPRVNTC